MEDKACDKNGKQIVSAIDSQKELKGLNEKQKLAIVSLIKETSYSGPIPPPEVFKGYIEINPEYGNKIFSMVEKEAEYRHKRDQRLINISARGQILAFIIAVFVIASGVYAIFTGSTAIACTIFGTTIVGLVAAFFKN